MASYDVEESPDSVHGPTYKVHGKAYVRIGSLLPGQNMTPQYTQIYCYDPDDESNQIDVRLNHVHLDRNMSVAQQHIVRGIFEELEESLNGCNPYVQQFKYANELDIQEDFNISFHPEIVSSGQHPHVYNSPSHELCVCAANIGCGKYPPVILRKHQ